MQNSARKGRFFRLSAGFADNCGVGVSPAQDVVGEPGRRDARTTNLAESQYSKRVGIEPEEPVYCVSDGQILLLVRSATHSLESASIAVIVKRSSSEPTTAGCSVGRGYETAGRKSSIRCHPSRVRRQLPEMSSVAMAGPAASLASHGRTNTAMMSQRNLDTARP